MASNTDIGAKIALPHILDAQVAQSASLTSDYIDTHAFGQVQAIGIAFNVGITADTLSGSIYWTLSVLDDAATGGSYTAAAAASIIGIDVYPNGGGVGSRTAGGTNAYVIDDNTEDDVTVVFWVDPSLVARYIKGSVAKTGSHSSGTEFSANGVIVKGLAS